MTLHSIGDQARKRIQEALSRGLERTGSAVRRKPFAAAAVIAVAGMLAGAGMGSAEISRLQAQLDSQGSAVDAPQASPCSRPAASTSCSEGMDSDTYGSCSRKRAV